MHEASIDTIRCFNRFCIRRIDVLHESPPDSKFTPTESRLLRELVHADGLTAADLSRTLELDAGYLSHLLTGLTKRGLIKRMRSADDARQHHLALTAAGQHPFAPLDRRSRADVGALLATLGEPQERQLLASMATIERLLDEPTERAAPLRRHRLAGLAPWRARCRRIRPGHRLLSAGRSHRRRLRRALRCAARGLLDRRTRRRTHRQHLSRAGTRRDHAGAARRHRSAAHAAHRLWGARSGPRQAAGQRECTQFARAAGYRKIVLWTNANLLAARGVCARAGYMLTHGEPHCSFGHDLVGEIWELAL